MLRDWQANLTSLLCSAGSAGGVSARVQPGAPVSQLGNVRLGVTRLPSSPRLTPTAPGGTLPPPLLPPHHHAPACTATHPACGKVQGEHAALRGVGAHIDAHDVSIAHQRPNIGGLPRLGELGDQGGGRDAQHPVVLTPPGQLGHQEPRSGAGGGLRHHSPALDPLEQGVDRAHGGPRPGSLPRWAYPPRRNPERSVI